MQRKILVVGSSNTDMVYEVRLIKANSMNKLDNASFYFKAI
ncbi:hypothetical protein SAMN05444395_10920 [Flavobacterium fryxellicola]|nr:hypothetical protein [Flavobacterium fryxellicola]SHN74996.1 hypothetical protein SAMN05444395_10920 [Flavobacterium fryxellicola]